MAKFYVTTSAMCCYSQTLEIEATTAAEAEEKARVETQEIHTNVDEVRIDEISRHAPPDWCNDQEHEQQPHDDTPSLDTTFHDIEMDIG